MGINQDKWVTQFLKDICHRYIIDKAKDMTTDDIIDIINGIPEWLDKRGWLAKPRENISAGERARQIISLKYISGMTFNEIANTLHMSYSHVYRIYTDTIQYIRFSKYIERRVYGIPHEEALIEDQNYWTARGLLLEFSYMYEGWQELIEVYDKETALTIYPVRDELKYTRRFRRLCNEIGMSAKIHPFDDYHGKLYYRVVVNELYRHNTGDYESPDKF